MNQIIRLKMATKNNNTTPTHDMIPNKWKQKSEKQIDQY